MQIRNKMITPDWQKPPVGTHITQTGPNARVNLGSVDASTNIAVSSPDQFFEEMRHVIGVGISDLDKKEQLLSAVQELEDTKGMNGFGQAYLRFTSVAADHLQLLQPFLPALAQMVGASLAGG